MQRKQLCSSPVFPSSSQWSSQEEKEKACMSIQSGKGQFLWLCHWHKTMRVLRKKWHGNVETKNTTDAVVVKCIGRRGSSFFHSFPNKSTGFSMLFLLLLCFILRDVLVLPRKQRKGMVMVFAWKKYMYLVYLTNGRILPSLLFGFSSFL